MLAFRFLSSLILSVFFFSLSVDAMDEPMQSDAGKPIVLKRKRHDDEDRRSTKKIRVVVQPDNVLHPNIDLSILTAGNLIPLAQQRNLCGAHMAGQKRTWHKNDGLAISVVGGSDACFALHPGKNYLYVDERIKVKLAQIISINPDAVGASHSQAGDWVAIEIRSTKFDMNFTNVLKRVEDILVGEQFIFTDKKGYRFARAFKLSNRIRFSDWLSTKDKLREYDANFFVQTCDIFRSLVKEQAHELLMCFDSESFNDVNMTVHSIESVEIEFGNAIDFSGNVDGNSAHEFDRLCDEDGIYIFGVMSKFLESCSYPEMVQNEFRCFAESEMDWYLNKYRSSSSQSCSSKVFQNLVNKLPAYSESSSGQNTDDTMSDQFGD